MVKPSIIGKSVRSEERMSDTDIKYKGVRKRKWGKWVSEVRLPNSRERIWLGSYDSAEKAARAFDAAQLCLRGPSARLNFPGCSCPEIPRGGGPLTHQEIQTIATRFASSGASVAPPTSAEASSFMAAAEYYSSDSGRTSPDSPSCSISAGSVQPDAAIDGPFTDFFVDSGSQSYKPLDYGIFPGFDDLTDDYYHHTIPIAQLEEEKFDDMSGQEFFLWNY